MESKRESRLRPRRNPNSEVVSQSTPEQSPPQSPFLGRHLPPTPGTIGNALQNEITNLLTKDETLMNVITEAVAKAISAHIIASTSLIKDIAETITSDATFTEQISQNIHTALEIGESARTKRLVEHQAQLEKKIKVLEDKQEEQEQYSRRNCLLIHGIEEDDDEDTTQLAINTFINRLELNDIRAIDIDRSHRLGRKKISPDGDGRPSRPRPVIIKFCSYTVRESVYSAKYKLKKSNILITESLTTSRLELLKKTKSHKKVSKAWTMDGRVACCLHSNPKKKIYIRNHGDISNL